MEETILEEKETEAFVERIIFINRVTKVTKGGKNLAFTALVVVGDQNGRVGFALGKAREVADAIRKGIKRAKKEMVEVKLKGRTISHQVKGKFGATEVLLKPAYPGTGVIAGATVRAICECAGIRDILTKILKKSTNPVNVTKAVFDAFSKLKG
ncbi:MAG: 30S ribosomal protein S5 [Candidatus Omnitrophica bacterium 4484_70.2]|nr:MAG: 30S ribosomal protein S5 [Candidatus Omnitrophica bacterium 4484_70.2]